MLSNNAFTQDTFEVREERTLLIQINAAVTIPLLSGLASEIATWASTCYDVHRAKRALAEVEKNEAVAATTVVKEALAFLKEEYMIVRKFSRNLFASTPERAEGYQLHLPYPNTKSEQLARAQNLVDEHARMVDDDITPRLPDSLATRIETALAACIAAVKAQGDEKGQAGHARMMFDVHWNLETSYLKDIYYLAIATWGDDHINLNDLGFIRKSQMGQGGGGTPPQPPSGLHLNDETLAWTAVPGATSYAVGLSNDGGTHWETDFTTSTNSATVPVIEIGKLYYRVRSRNANGYGDYSGTYEHLFGLAAVENFENTGSDFSWSPVEFANGYDIERSATGEDLWALIFNSGGTSMSNSPGPGNWTYRIRASYGSVKGEWTELETIFV
jgi:hypothetical protein